MQWLARLLRHHRVRRVLVVLRIAQHSVPSHSWVHLKGGGQSPLLCNSGLLAAERLAGVMMCCASRQDDDDDAVPSSLPQPLCSKHTVPGGEVGGWVGGGKGRGITPKHSHTKDTTSCFHKKIFWFWCGRGWGGCVLQLSLGQTSPFPRSRHQRNRKRTDLAQHHVFCPALLSCALSVFCC